MVTFMPHACACHYSGTGYDDGITILKMCTLHSAAPDLLVALNKIANTPEGVYSRDREQYLTNVIAWCKETAIAAIAKATRHSPVDGLDNG